MTHKVLIVDDEPDVLESTALLVESLGYEAHRLEDAHQVLEHIHRLKPDAILQDIKMPGLNLAGLSAALRSDPETADIPLIFFGAGRELGATATRYNAWGYLTKPFGKGDLHRILSQIFRQTPGAHGRDVQREVAGLFHDILDHVTAVTNYHRVMEVNEHLDRAGQKALRGAGEALLKLEVRMNRLRTYVTGLAAGLESAHTPPVEQATPVPSADQPPASDPAARSTQTPPQTSIPPQTSGQPQMSPPPRRSSRPQRMR